jgi:transposase
VQKHRVRMQSIRVDNIPLIAFYLLQADLIKKVDEHYTPHGNWEGASFGITIAVWLTYILSKNDHALYKVEDWAKDHLYILRKAYKYPELKVIDLEEGRLATILDYLTPQEDWQEFESSFNRNFIHVYDLAPADQQNVFRIDLTNIPSYRQASGMFQKGYSKQRNKSLPQMKAVLTTFDPYSVPMTVQIISGDCADDQHYIPAIENLAKTLDIAGKLFVADCKAGSHENRKRMIELGVYYLCPASKKQCSNESLRRLLSKKPKETTCIYEKSKNGKEELKAELFEVVDSSEPVSSGLGINERLVIVCSMAYRVTQLAAFEKHKEKCLKELPTIFVKKQGKRYPKTLEEANEIAKSVLKNHKMEDFVSFTVTFKSEEKATKGYQGKEARTETKLTFDITVEKNDDQIAAHKELLGWRVYLTNAPKENLTSEQIVELYWQEYKIEHVFNDLLNKITALLPVYLHSQTRVVALVRLLTVALKFTALIQSRVAKKLDERKTKIDNLYPGNPGRKTSAPSIALIFRAFDGFDLIIEEFDDGTWKATADPLKEVQKILLELLDIPESAYSTDLEAT